MDPRPHDALLTHCHHELTARSVRMSVRPQASLDLSVPLPVRSRQLSVLLCAPSSLSGANELRSSTKPPNSAHASVLMTLCLTRA